jgi:hypothetical protein
MKSVEKSVKICVDKISRILQQMSNDKTHT